MLPYFVALLFITRVTNIAAENHHDGKLWIDLNNRKSCALVYHLLISDCTIL